MQQPISVVWHKSTDLRTHDHEPLARAHSSNLAVLHVFVVDPYWWAPTAPGGRRRTGALRTRFLRECLEGLRESLAAHGQHLAVLRGDTAECFAALCRRHRVATVHAFAEVCSEEVAIERRVAEVLRAAGARLELSWGFTLYHRDDLPPRTS